MSNALLTLVIPTYNRAKYLSLLLSTLVVELRGLEGKVRVIVGDNASPDNTPLVTQAFLAAIPTAKIQRHSENLGSDENFCRCIENVETRYYWIIGDDDLPKRGVIAKIVTLLECEDIDLLYLNSEWRPNITGADDGEPVLTLKTRVLSREKFAEQVNVWFTFISGIVVNRERLLELNPNLALRRFSGTSLVQLGWTLPLLMTGNHFKYIEQRCVLATANNTGGYKVIAVFGTNLPAIVDTVCGRSTKESNSIISRLVWSYLPVLLWVTRFGRVGDFVTENLLDSLKPLRNNSAYWLLILPMAVLPRIFALPFLLISKLLSWRLNLHFG